MTKAHTLAASFLRWTSRVAIPSLGVCCLASAQVYYPAKEVRLRDLPGLTAKSKDASDVLAASL
jgi:hypothetical protein